MRVLTGALTMHNPTEPASLRGWIAKRDHVYRETH
eukprot:SAG11_NODE_4286_length_1968_cov_1.533440_5_plen_34_part_01